MAHGVTEDGIGDILLQEVAKRLKGRKAPRVIDENTHRLAAQPRDSNPSQSAIELVSISATIPTGKGFCVGRDWAGIFRPGRPVPSHRDRDSRLRIHQSPGKLMTFVPAAGKPLSRGTAWWSW